MKPRYHLTFAAVLPLALASNSKAQSTYNNSTADNLAWGTPGNWTPATVPNAVDAEAILNGAGPSSTPPANLALDVLLDGNYTIGKFTRNLPGGQAATFPTTPTGFDVTKGLTLQKTSGTPEINVLGDVFFYSSIFGTQGFEKTGAGRFTQRFNGINQTYTGLVKITAGTLGIEKDGSLGDVNNDLEIADGARLFAEPGANSGTVTLPATRSITLTGAEPQIGAAQTAVNLIVTGPISDNGNGFGLVKTDAGVVTLAGTNSWTGSTKVNGGVLSATKPEALPGYDTQTYNVNGTSTLAVRYGDASTWTDVQIGNLINNASFATAASFGIDTTGNASTATYTGDLSTFNFSKIGAGRLILSSPQTVIAAISLFGGSLEIGASGGLPSGLVFKNLAGGTTLDLGGTSATFADLQEVSGGTTTITNGSLTFNGASDLNVTGANNTRLNLSGLNSFTYDNPAKAFQSFPATATTDTINEFSLAATGPGTNLVNAFSVAVGGASGTSQGNAHQGQLRLGGSNTFNTPTFRIGGFNGSGLVTYQAGLSSPVFKLRAADTTSAATKLTVGETSSGSRSGAGTLNLTDGSADILVTDIVLGRHIAGSDNGNTSTITIPDGSVTATTLLMSTKENGGSPVLTSVFNQAGGNVSITSIVMGQTSASPSGIQNLRPTYNLEGGTLSVTEIKQGTLATPPSTASQVETATAVGTITAAGNVSVTVTGAGITGSPLLINVPVTNGDTATVWAGKVRTALGATPAITSLYTVGGTTTAVVLTRITTGIYDATLNVALANGTTTGVTAAPNSANTNANVVSNIIRNLTLNGGTLINKTGGDLTITGVTVNVPLTSSAVVDSTALQKVIIGTGATFAPRIDSSANIAGTLVVDGDLELAASPVLAVTDTAGTPVALPAGTELVLINYTNGSLTGTFSGIADGGTITVGPNQFVVDYNDPDYAGKAVTLTSNNVAAGYADWAANNGIPGAPFGIDSDNDGLDNGTEYGIGSNPTAFTPAAGLVKSGINYTLTYPKGTLAAADPAIDYLFETSPDLTSWTAVAPTTETGSAFSFTLLGGGTSQFVRAAIKQLP